ncbi:MAG: cell division topological specificity factor MinE [Gammaproteobacteria bacterium]|nr:cell division topological specificity factor MinE [Gammaproteobacteria bacterium]
MNLLQRLRRNRKSANIAKDRLHIIIAQERVQNSTPDFLPMMRKEILAIVAKYTSVNVDDVKVDLHCKDNNSVLELNVALPETAKAES